MKLPTFCLFLALTVLSRGETSGTIKLPDPGPPPAGFKTPAEMKTALFTQRVPLMPLQTLTPPEVVEKADVVYGKTAQKELKLDLYLPKEAGKPRAGLIFIHGGAWIGGTRDMYKNYCVSYAKKGYAAATITYRLAGEAPFPACLEDVKCAVRWMRTHAAENGIDPERIALVGGSAGGHLALMAGYTCGNKEFEGSGGCPECSSGVCAVVDIYGVTDLTSGPASAQSLIERVLAKKWPQDKAAFANASPLFHVSKGDPPTLILHGTIDDTVLIAQSDALAAKLKECEVPYFYDRLEGWPHVMDMAKPVNDRLQCLMDAFFAKHLAPVNSAASDKKG